MPSHDRSPRRHSHRRREEERDGREHRDRREHGREHGRDYGRDHGRDYGRDHGRDYGREYDRGHRREERRGRRSPGREERRDGRGERRRRRTSAWDQAPAAAGAAVDAHAPGAGLAPLSAARQARRLFVGDLPAAAAEEDVRRLFAEHLQAAGLAAAGADPVAHFHANREKAFCFVELATAAQATRGLALDGAALAGGRLHVRRPHDYVEPAGLGGPLLTSIPDGPNKVFLGGLPAHVSDQQVMELAAKHGRLRGFSVVRDHNGACKGFGFLEYADPSVTDDACRKLSGVRLGDKTLLARRSMKAHEGGGRFGGRMQAHQPPQPARIVRSTVDNLLNLSLPVASSLAAVRAPGVDEAAPGGPLAPTRVLALLNAVSLDDVKDERKHAEIVEDVGSECEQFGAVETVLVPRPNAEQPAKGVGRVFVCFRDVEAAVAAQKALAFRRFNHRCLLTCFFPEALWESGELSGDPERSNEATVPDDQPAAPAYNSMPPPRHL